MKQKLISKLRFRIFSRWVNFVTAVLLVGIAVAPLFDQTASAYTGGQVQSRFIELSNSTNSATGVTYNVSFIPTSATPIGGIVVDFCSDSPITFSTTCALPTGFTLGSSAAVSGLTGIGTGGSWITTNSQQCAAPPSNLQSLYYTNTTAQTPTYTGGTVPINFQITGVTNPTATGYFYARIYTFPTSADATAGYTCSTTSRTITTSDIQDYGGIAISTTQQIQISATVQETLDFCVSAGAIGGSCSGATTPTLTIGTGSPPVLDTSGEEAEAYTQVSTNALHGVAVNMKATNACTNGGLSTAPPDSGGGCLNLPGIGSTAHILTNATTGSWGMCVAPGGGVTAATNYKDTVNSCPTSFSATSLYGMNGANLTGTYGDMIYNSSGALTNSDSQLEFAALASNTTPAGIYQGNEILIATGTY